MTSPTVGQRGLVLMALMVLVALLGAATVQAGAAWADERQRENEAQLLFIGQQFRQALESYYLAGPSTVRHLPVKLEDLLLDRRFPQPVRHLRKLWPDPLSPDTPWGVLRQGQQIIGIYSQAPGEPRKRAGFDNGLESFTGARTYAQWQFIFVPRSGTTPGAGATTTPPSAVPLDPSARKP